MRNDTKEKRHFPKQNTGKRDFAREERAPLDENTVIGRNAVYELLQSGRSVDKLFVAKGDRDGSIVKIVALALDRRIPVVEADRKKLDLMAMSTRHQGVIAMAAEREYVSLDDVIAYAEERGEEPIVAILDGVEDPHNLGAIIRSAECCGIHGIVIPKRRSVGLTPVVTKSSAGAIEHMAIAKVTNIAATVELLKKKGVWVFAAEAGGKAYYDTDFDCAVAIVLGSEGDGVSSIVKEKSDFITSIPMYGKVNSLNVSTAAAVILSEVARQHKGNKN